MLKAPHSPGVQRSIITSKLVPNNTQLNLGSLRSQTHCKRQLNSLVLKWNLFKLQQQRKLDCTYVLLRLPFVLKIDLLFNNFHLDTGVIFVHSCWISSSCEKLTLRRAWSLAYYCRKRDKIIDWKLLNCQHTVDFDNARFKSCLGLAGPVYPVLR